MVHFHFHIAFEFSGIEIHWLYSQDYNNIKLSQTSQVPTFPRAACNCEMIYLSMQLQSNLSAHKRWRNVNKYLWWLPLNWSYRLVGMLQSRRRTICRKMKGGDLIKTTFSVHVFMYIGMCAWSNEHCLSGGGQIGRCQPGFDVVFRYFKCQAATSSGLAELRNQLSCSQSSVSKLILC